MISGMDKVRIAAQSGRSPKTVDRVYRGEGNPYSRDAVKRAAADLGLPAPPERSPSSSPEPSPTSSKAA
jgi:hypothetical protein